MILTAGTKRAHVLTLREASNVYCKWRDRSGRGASRFPSGMVLDGVLVVARVSYNGRVWPPGEWKADDVPLYDNRGVAP